MILLLDIGNSRLKWCSYTADQLGELQAIAHVNQLTTQQLDNAWLSLPPPEAVYLVSVAGSEVATVVSNWVWDNWAVIPTALTSKARCAGVTNGYLKPEQLGVDRWAAIIGAYQLTQGAVCVIDSGTALTCDVISSEGRHLGGLITPGRALQQQILLHGTAGIALEAEEKGLGMWGRETTSCVKSGILQSQLALVERCLHQFQAEQAESVSLVVTGGDASLLLPYLPPSVRFEPYLVFQGMTYMMLEQGG